jgi:acetolactate synthase-1/2/3 large subunit
MNAAELFVQCLEQENFKYIFRVPGEENEDFLLAIQTSSIQFIPVRHEQGGAFIANMIGRLTGKAGLCLSTLGPGATNLITGVADAFLDKSPLIALTGQGSTSRLHHESHQIIDVVSLFRPICKFNTSINDPSIIPEVVRKAVKIAESEKPGAVHIELPEDIAGSCDFRDLTPLDKSETRIGPPDPYLLNQVGKTLSKANKPLIIAGNGAIRNRSSNAIFHFSKTHNMPVVSTFMGKGAVSDKESTSLGAMGLGFKDYVIEALEESDYILACGYDIAEYDPANWNIGIKKKLVHIDFEPAEINDKYIPEIEIVADIQTTIEKLSYQINNRVWQDWFVDIRQRINKSIDQYSQSDDDKTFTVPGVLNIIREILPDNGLLISDVGSHKMWIARNFKTYCPNGCIISNGLASMGISLPGGIAASLLDPNRKVVSMMGDGGALMNIQELETAKRLGVGYTIIIVNDNNYGLIEWKQKMNHGKSFGTRLSNPDFVKLAESFGVNGFRPQNIHELKNILSECLESRSLNLVEIPVDTEVNNQLTIELSEYFNK